MALTKFRALIEALMHVIGKEVITRGVATIEATEAAASPKKYY